MRALQGVGASPLQRYEVWRLSDVDDTVGVACLVCGAYPYDRQGCAYRSLAEGTWLFSWAVLSGSEGFPESRSQWVRGCSRSAQRQSYTKQKLR